MNQKLAILCLVAAILGFAAADLSCYTCSSTINEDNKEEYPSGKTQSCAQLVDTSVATYTLSCQTYYSYSNGTTTFSRGVSPKNQTDGCTSSPGNTVCYCNKDKCNNEKVTVPTTFECYQCDSTEFFDNGCGNVLNTASSHVKKITGCSACGKTVSTGSDYGTRYSRGCARSVENEEGCSGDSASSLCICKEALCNSAEGLSLKTTALVSALLLSLALKLSQ
jgi:hypothetical protein